MVIFQCFQLSMTILLFSDQYLNHHMRQVLLIFVLVLQGCNPAPKLFTKISAEHSGIDFVNSIKENTSENIYTFPHLYYGAGVAAGDLNNDGLVDIYLGGNQVSGKLYLNLGGFKFQDITKTAGLEDESAWETGINFIDINEDGWLDIYINTSGHLKNGKKTNKLYINNKDLTFTETAESYGLAEKRQVIQSTFFDYDKDGDLDVFMIVNPSDYNSHTVNNIRPKMNQGQAKSTDVLYQNNGDGTFTNVSLEAGILVEGYSLGVAIGDVNNDDWPDIYVSNDFLTNDVLYINQGDGSFKNKAKKYLSHTSFAGMGTDMADINNDGLIDIVQLDMLPEDNFRQKMILPGNNYNKFNLSISQGYEPQYTRNMLQVNNGTGPFSEIGFMSGISNTDWSWAPLLADFDNDGQRDLYITNGYFRDMGNMDFINYSQTSITSFGTESSRRQRYLDAVDNLETVSIPNYMYRNDGDLLFSNKTKDWGLEDKSVSNGALYADFDNDGDLDLIINNMDQPAFLYKNNSESRPGNQFLKIKLKGPSTNQQGIGVKITLKTNKQVQYYEHYLNGGYQSSVDPNIHFGLGAENQIASLKITWTDGRSEVLRGLKSNQNIILDHKNARFLNDPNTKAQNEEKLFAHLDTSIIGYLHQENKQVDFDRQPLLPHGHSNLGPGISVGDVDQNGFEDFYVGGAMGTNGVFFLQDSKGNFSSHPFDFDKYSEDMGSLLFDVEGDGDLDLYVVSGGTVFENQNLGYKDRLYINNGKGKFERIIRHCPIFYPVVHV